MSLTVNGSLPPRPRAIATLLTTDDFLPGAQTLLHSIKEKLPKETSISSDYYAPELIVVITPNVSQNVREILYPAFCTRLIEVDPIRPSHSIEQLSNSSVANNKSHVASWDDCGYTKLHIFDMDIYDKILYIDSDCLVLKDVSSLLQIDYSDSDQKGLIAAAPDIFPPDKFNAGVMVIAPSKAVFQDMMQKMNSSSSSTTDSMIKSYDGGDTGFLNGYFPHWYTSMPSSARLGFGYNAQRFMYNCTYQKQPKYWDDAIGENLTIVHYSSSPKPWENTRSSVATSDEQENLLSKDDARELSKAAVKPSPLDLKWKKCYEKSQRAFARMKEEEEWNQSQTQRRAAESKKKTSLQRTSQKRPSNPAKTSHNLVAKRFKELRKTGMDAKEAMATAQREHGAGEQPDAGTQVAAMFGMQM